MRSAANPRGVDLNVPKPSSERASAAVSAMPGAVYTPFDLTKAARPVIALHVGDGTIGWSEHAPYDAIIVTAGAPKAPQPLLDQLFVGGRLVIPVGDEQGQTLLRVVRTRTGFKETRLGECKFVKLLGKYGWRE